MVVQRFADNGRYVGLFPLAYGSRQGTMLAVTLTVGGCR